AYLAARIERSFAAAADIVAALDAAALAQRRDVNEALARGLLDKA
ncbi:MAG: chromosomal replication initiator DnaA, partial [Rhodobacteraceae bacterium]|nr:chromosomal replication initiator DnaA [Paracoccaceae bacterium]